MPLEVGMDSSNKKPPTEEPVSEEHQDASKHLPMDTGLEAWLQVLGSWILFANTWSVNPVPLFPPDRANCDHRGLTNSFGIFQTYYTDVVLPDTDPSAIAWIGSIQLFLMMLIGVCAGWLLDAGYLRFVLFCGTTMTFLGTFMLSLCTKYWQILLSQAFCVGIGSGMLGLTSVAIIPLYFQQKRMMATGIAATGSSLGMATCPHNGGSTLTHK